MTEVGGFCGLTWVMNVFANTGHSVIVKALFSSDPGIWQAPF